MPDEASILRDLVQSELRKLRNDPNLIVTRLTFDTSSTAFAAVNVYQNPDRVH